MAARLLAAFALIAPTASLAQQANFGSALRQDGRVDERVERRARSAFTEADPLNDGLDMGLILSVAYDDNIFLSPAAARDDVVTRVTPHVAVAVGKPDADSGGWVRAAYRPTAVVYADHSDQNRIDHEIVWEAAWRGKATIVSGGGSFRRTAEPTADTGGQTERNETANLVRLAWTPREKLTVEAGVGQRSTRYDDRRLYDSSGLRGELAFLHTYSPKTRIGLRGRMGVDEVQGAGNQNVASVTALLDWSPREKITIGIEAGAEHRSFDNGSDTNPVVEARVAWRPDFATEVYGGIYQRTLSSGYYPGQNYDLSGIHGGFSRNLGEHWSARLECGWEKASYTRVSGTGPAGRDDRILFVRPGAEYRINDQSAIAIFYCYSRDDSNQPGFGYENHSAGVEFRTRF